MTPSREGSIQEQSLDMVGKRYIFWLGQLTEFLAQWVFCCCCSFVSAKLVNAVKKFESEISKLWTLKASDNNSSRECQSL